MLTQEWKSTGKKMEITWVLLNMDALGFRVPEHGFGDFVEHSKCINWWPGFKHGTLVLEANCVYPHDGSGKQWRLNLRTKPDARCSPHQHTSSLLYL